MKKLTHGFTLKLLAFVLCLACLLAAVGGTVGLILMGEANILRIPEKTLRSNTLNQYLASMTDDLVQYALFYEEGASAIYDPAYSNLRYIVSFNGHVIDTNYSNVWQNGVSLHREFILGDLFDFCYSNPVNLPEIPGLQKLLEKSSHSVASVYDIRVTVDMCLPEPPTIRDTFYTVDAAVHLLCVVRPHLGWIIAGGLLLGILLLVYLFHAAGRRPSTEEVTPNLLDRIPADLYLAICTGLCILLCAFLIYCVDQATYTLVLGWLIPAALAVLAFVTIVLGFFLSVATRIKLGTLGKNTVIWYILSFLGRGARRVWQGLCYVVRSLPTVWRTVLGLGVVLAVDFFITIWLMNLWHEEDIELFYWLVKTLVLVAAVLVVALNLRAVRQGCRDLAAGRLDSRVDTRRLIGDFRAAGEDVNNIGKGMAKAVEERMKSERMKTELITNVSHDIKTPLTSIINYVDLIKKENPESPVLQEYVDVLDRQSTRLKKLIDDLMEASKASTGALTNNPEPFDLGVMLQQSAGEFTEKLAAAALTPVVDHPEKPVYILADGRHLARVFDNLLNNACKYGQPGTRLYLSLKETGGKAVVTLRNISRDALNIDGSELMERFVRGDRSRHTEGSGLGLSIARSLVELQGGAMKLAVDGDLFKVTLVFPAVPAPQPDAGEESVSAFDTAMEAVMEAAYVPIAAQAPEISAPAAAEAGTAAETGTAESVPEVSSEEDLSAASIAAPTE